MAVIKLENIVKRFGSTIAVNDVSLEIKDGEFLVLLGPSGCGKTTTLRSIAGLEEIDEGQIFIDEDSVNRKRPSERDIAFCFQHYALYPHLTAYNNIAFPLRTQKVKPDEIEERVSSVGEILDLNEIFDQKPKKLSSGDQQRVALARAMVRQPKVFLMDEPLSNLDAKLRVDMRSKLRLLQINNKITTIYVTHDQSEAMALADRIAIMNEGKLLQVDTPEEIYAHPVNMFVANFIGSPSMNFIDCQYEKSSHTLLIPTNGEITKYPLPQILTQNIDDLEDGAELILGVRPEDINIFSRPIEGAIVCTMMLTEELGSENIHHVSSHNLNFIIRTKPDEKYAMDQPLWINFEPAGIRLFDKNNQAAI